MTSPTLTQIWRTNTQTSTSPGPPDLRPWAPDLELTGYEQRTIPLPGEPVHGLETEGGLVATLVRRGVPTRRRAVLYVHGWSDYFFQRHLADEMDALGYDFYALDLRRYGRSLRDKHLAGYITSLEEYFVELDAAVSILRDEGHDSLVLMGHSTGGLVSSLYASERPGVLSALVLNSPWLELQGNAVLRPLTRPVFTAARAVAAVTALPFTDNVFYRRCISSSEEGEWDYNHNLKGDPAFLIRFGWAAAILEGHARVAAGLGIDCPVLVATSSRSDFRRTWDESLREADIVLDVDRIAERVHRLGDHVTLVRIAGGLHDLALSSPRARGRFFDEVGRFLGCYACHS